MPTASVAATDTPHLSTAGAHAVLRRVFSFPVALGCALLTTVFMLAVNQPNHQFMADNDIWWHLNDARTLLTTHHFIRQELFSFTVAGKPWINFEWLADLPFYLAYQAQGARGVFAVMMLLFATILIGTYVLAYLRSGDIKAAFLATMVTGVLSTVSLGPRVLLFGWLLLLVELFILELYRAGRDVTWAAPVLFCLWINTHGSWMIGLVLWCLWVACGFVRGEWGAVVSRPWTTAQRRKLLVVTAISVLALFVNPYGWRLVAYPFDLAFQQQANIQMIAEWATLDMHTLRGKIVLFTLIGMAVLNLVRRRSWLLYELLFAAVAVYAGLTYSRFAFLAGILLAPMLALDLRGALGPYRSEADGIGRNVLALGVMGALVFWLMPSAGALDRGMNLTFPEQALPRVSQLAPGTRLFNQFDWGGYLQWKLPQQRVFIDSRDDIFVHEGVFQDYATANTGVNALEVLNKYRVDAVLLPPVSPLTYLLEHAQGWRVGYRDAGSVLFQRAGA